jgi:hypothetical protein
MIFASKPWVASLSVWASKLRSDISVDKRHHHKAWVKAKQNHKDMGSVGWGWKILDSFAHRCVYLVLVLEPWEHMNWGILDVLQVKDLYCNNPHSKLLIWSSSARETGLHMRSTPLTLSSSFCVKWLTHRCYVWNKKDYKLAFTLLSFRGNTKPTNHNHTWSTEPHGPTSQLLHATKWVGVLHSAPLRVDALGSSPHICDRCLEPSLGTPPPHEHMQQG